MTEAPLCLPLLAAITEQDYPQLAFWAVGCIGALAIFVDRVTATIERYRAKPPVHEVYATKADHSALSAKVEALSTQPYATRDELVKVHARIDGLMSDMSDAVKTATESMTADIGTAKKEVHEVMQSLQAIHRSIGQLEGSITSAKPRRVS
jgi:predicted  nucleic acid-binding Zn-ribbon protein